jgi:hypothetical protein
MPAPEYPESVAEGPGSKTADFGLQLRSQLPGQPWAEAEQDERWGETQTFFSSNSQAELQVMAGYRLMQQKLDESWVGFFHPTFQRWCSS